MEAYSAEITQSYILNFIIPFWLIVGFGDYLCHRATHIEKTSGLKESMIHALMFIEITIPVMLGLHFEITSLIVLIVLIAFVVHEITAVWDIAYAHPRREVGPIEQHLHSYLAVIPFMVMSFILCLHWGDFTALFGFGEAPADFGLRWRQPPLSATYHIIVSVIAVLFLVVPYSEELWRCFQYERRHGVPSQADTVLPTG